MGTKAGATSERWLDQLRPRVAVVSVGRTNRYGHPAPGVMARLGRRDIDVYRTDRDGTIVIRTDGHNLMVDTNSERF